MKYFDINFRRICETILCTLKENINNNCLEKGLALMCNCARNAFKPNFLSECFYLYNNLISLSAHFSGQ